MLGIVAGAIASLTLILAIIGVPLIIFSYKQLKKQPAKVDAWREEMARFQKLWVCKKCGNEWTPAET